MKRRHRKSDCPVHFALETFGDAWTLLIIRDLIFAGKRHFREFLQSDEGISSRTLAERLQTLQDEGIVTKSDDPTHKLKAIYRLTEAGIDLLPVLATLGAWGSKHRKADDKLARNADDLAAGGKAALDQMTVALRAEHLAST